MVVVTRAAGVGVAGVGVAGVGAALAPSFVGRFGSIFVWHGVCAFLAWGVLAPVGFAAARFLRRAGRGGVRLHRIAMLVVLALTAATWFIGIAWSRRDVPAGHAALGSLVSVLALLQGVAGALRPPLDAGSVRAAWASMHRALGAVALAAGAYTTHHSLYVFDISNGISRIVDAVLAVAVVCILAVEIAPSRAFDRVRGQEQRYFGDGLDDAGLGVKYAAGIDGVPVEFREVQDEEGEGDVEEERLAFTPGR